MNVSLGYLWSNILELNSWRALLTKRIYANEAEADLRSAWQLLTVREELTSRPQNDEFFYQNHVFPIFKR